MVSWTILVDGRIAGGGGHYGAPALQNWRATVRHDDLTGIMFETTLQQRLQFLIIYVFLIMMPSAGCKS